MNGPLRKSGIEYVEWALNWRRGCANGCTYCYARAMAHRFGTTPDGGWVCSERAFEDPVEALYEQLARKRKPVTGHILVSSSHDPFMHRGCAVETGSMVTVLEQAGLGSQVMLLTKAPLRALGLHNGDPRWICDPVWFGVSLTTLRTGQVDSYEPGAERPEDRLKGLVYAANRGMRTWVSVEPSLPGQRLDDLVRAVRVIVRNYHIEPKPWIVIGKLNYNGPDEILRHWSYHGPWAEMREAAVSELEYAGYKQSLTPIPGYYWVKQELARV